MTKILLVNTNTEKLPYPVPPLGLCLLASWLDERYEVSIYDGMFGDTAGLVEHVLQFAPDYIGFSIRNIDSTMSDNPVYYVDDLIAQFIRPVREISAAKIILGGSGFSIYAGELMEITGADYGIIGEAEASLPGLIDALERGEEVRSGRNLLVKAGTDGKKVLHITERMMIKERFSEIDRRIDFSPYKQRGAYAIQTKRGCSHGCIYCTYPVIEGRTFRTRNPAAIAEEIEQACERLGDVMFEFVDSTFNDPAGHAEAICREIIRRKLKVRLRTMGINPMNTSEELFHLMMEAGFVQIDATPDSASPAMLASLGKGFTLPEIEKMAALIRKFDLPTMWFFLFGGPGENERTFNETVDFIDRHINPADLVYMASGLRIYPGTPLEKVALKEQVILPGESLLYPPLFYFSKEISRDRLNEMMLDVSSLRHNCIHSAETKPSPEMMQEAQKLRAELNLNEPMFRTLLRLRKKAK
ncbi:MAG: radical SAM protein [Bacteroidetes bacterium]|nr:radical SAM protein [Bacteroidota bacterium]